MMPFFTKFQQASTASRKAIQPILRKGWWHWVRFAGLLALGSYLGHILSESPRFSDIRYELYQRQVRFQHRGRIYPQHTALILLDDDDYWSEEYQARAPYKRDKLAELLDRLNEAGANIVGFDIDWSSPLTKSPTYDFPDYVHEDELFFAAVKRMCDAGRRVVLTDGVTGHDEPPYYHQIPTIYTSRLTTLPCVTVGHDGFDTDMRKIPGMVRLDTGGYIDSFSLAIVKVVDPVSYQELVKAKDKGFRFGNYLTPEDFKPRAGRRFVYNGKSVAEMNPTELRQALAGRAVIVGGDYSMFAYGQGSHIDEHNSPGGREPGAMLHANYVEAELNQDSTFTPISDNTAEVLEWSLAFILALIAALNVPAAWKWGSVGICFVFSVLLTYVLMQNLGLFLDFFVPVSNDCGPYCNGRDTRNAARAETHTAFTQGADTMTDLDDLGDRGTTRGDGTPVKVVVKFNKTAVAGITVSAQATGKAAVMKTTGADGVAAFTLAAGHYTVHASNGQGAASKSITVVDSTSTEIVSLALAPTAAQH